MTICLGELFIQFTVRVSRLSICLCASFPFGFEGGMWVMIVLLPDHCPSFLLCFFLTHVPLFCLELFQYCQKNTHSVHFFITTSARHNLKPTLNIAMWPFLNLFTI